MEPRRDRVQDRILPAVLTALGVTFLAAGLLTWTVPVEAGPPPSVPDNGAAASEPPESLEPAITLPPLGSAPPSSGDPTQQTPDPLVVEPDEDRVATRVRVRALDIDLPVIRGDDEYPLCNVAMYIRQLSQPGNGGATYLYGHARPGMFEPLLRTKAADQLGIIAEVWTNDDLKFLYEIIEVRRHQTSLDAPRKVKRDELWLQTSEGPRGTVGKTQVRARLLSVERAAHGPANPTPKPVNCE
jgi:sortase (surface protein transpeptidase)